MAVTANKDIFRFEITVDDPCGMESLAAFYYFSSIEPSPVSTQTTPSGKLRRQVTARMEVL
jgi:hypothetical protein